MASKKKRTARQKKSTVAKTKAGKTPSKAFSFIQARLKTNPEASFASIRDAAVKKLLKIAPILYGRVKALMGLIPMSKYGESKKRAAAGLAARRGPGRPRKTTVSPGLLAEIHEMHREREEMRDVLGRIRVLLNRVI